MGGKRTHLLSLLLSFGAQVDEVDYHGNDLVARRVSQKYEDLIALIQSTSKPPFHGSASKDNMNLESKAAAPPLQRATSPWCHGHRLRSEGQSVDG